MAQVLIVVDAGVDEQLQGTPAISESARVAIAMQQAIAQTTPDVAIHLTTVEASWTQAASEQEDWIVCPLTLALPNSFSFSRRELYAICRDVETLRHRVYQQLAYPVGSGLFWLPIVLTAKGPLYAEAIAPVEPSSAVLSSTAPYIQPLHLSDRWRQAVYQMGYQVLRSLSAPPATYLVQFGFQDDRVYFDRLFPFPVAPAIASLGIQSPDLFICHWYCLIGKPILDLAIAHSTPHQWYRG